MRLLVGKFIWLLEFFMGLLLENSMGLYVAVFMGYQNTKLSEHLISELITGLSVGIFDGILVLCIGLSELLKRFSRLLTSNGVIG